MKSATFLPGLLIAVWGAFAPEAAADAGHTAAPEAIAVIGTGSVGGTLGRRWGLAGHTIYYGSRDPDRDEVRGLVAESGPSAAAMLPAEAAARARVVLLAVPWTAVEASVVSLGDLDGKILIDVNNPLGIRNGELIEFPVPHSGAELIQGLAPGARVVKAFNTLNWRIMQDPAAAGGPVTIGLAGDDAEAKRVVAGLVAELGLEPYDAGPLGNARYLEAMAMLYVSLMIDRPPRRFEFYLRPQD